ncbi:MAG: DNA gyrase inhibitor YacG [Steroidobacteraceae bacterium]|nr:DNA gyrase inhibitor YacG [Steroidobacteraceae bacterium]
MTAPRAKCPTCGHSMEWSPANPWRPFCGERCRLIDLGAWLTERHAIPGEPAPAPGDAVPVDDGVGDDRRGDDGRRAGGPRRGR